MIDPEITQRAEAFENDWSLRFKQIPELMLDGSWPAVGILDLLTYRLRGLTSLGSSEEELIRGVVSSLAVMTEWCWSSYGITVEVENTDQGILVSGTGGEFLSSGESVVLPLEQALRSLVLERPREMEPIAGFPRILSPDHNYLSLFAIGVVTGRGPAVQGKWKEVSEQDFKPYLQRVSKVLAKSCASHYERLYPSEQLGQVAELYLNGLIYPPALCIEQLPACFAVRGVMNFAREYKLDSVGLKRIAENLCQSSDELISSAGLALYGALAEGNIPKRVLAAAQRKGLYVGLLRQAMLNVRKELELGSDWILGSTFTKADEARWRIEHTMGFLPWVRSSLVGKDKYKELLYLLATFEFANSVRLCDRLIEDDPKDIPLRLQRIGMSLLGSDFQDAVNRGKTLLTEPGCEVNAALLDLLGLAKLSLGDLPGAVKDLKGAFDLLTAETPESHKVANNYGWALLLLEQFQQAIEVFDYAIRRDPCPVTALLNKAFCLRSLGEEEALLEVEDKLLQLSPTDRRVFGNFVIRVTEG